MWNQDVQNRERINCGPFAIKIGLAARDFKDSEKGGDELIV
jgi:hypothetical protein